MCCAEARTEAARDTIILETSMLTRGMRCQGVNRQSIWTIYVNARLQLLHLDTSRYWINGQNLRVGHFSCSLKLLACVVRIMKICCPRRPINFLLSSSDFKQGPFSGRDAWLNLQSKWYSIVVLWHSRVGHRPPYNGYGCEIRLPSPYRCWYCLHQSYYNVWLQTPA